jgi:hypothetical protein
MENLRDEFGSVADFRVSQQIVDVILDLRREMCGRWATFSICAPFKSGASTWNSQGEM